MANSELLDIISQGAKVWNAWRLENPSVKVDLSEAHLYRVNFQNFNLGDANLENVCAESANLAGATLRRSKLVGIDLRRASLRDVDLWRADLRNANLWGAYIRRTNISGANLCAAYLRGASLGNSQLGDLDLSGTRGLDGVRHFGPSSLGTDTIFRSEGKIPEEFLRGCGLADWEIEAAKLYNPDLTEEERNAIAYEMLRIQGEQPIQMNPLFVSYSRFDSAFVEKLEPQFDKLGIRYWRDLHDMKAGRMEAQIDRAIRLNPTVLLVLSENSVESDWVEWEAAKARELEKELGRDVLCPVALDDVWKTYSWPGLLRRQIEDYNILDFSGWRDSTTFERQFAKLFDGLKLFYRPKGS